MLKVVRELKTESIRLTKKVTIHFAEDRRNRDEFIKSHMGYGETVDMFLVDTNHKNGLEIHEVTSTGVVRIYNSRTLRWVTMLIARPNQIERYYRALNRKAPQNVLKMAYTHQTLGWNEI